MDRTMETDFRIIVDTREQEPFGFDCQTLRKKLEAGDYSVQGFEAVVAVERKSLSDFVGTAIHDMARFRAEMENLSGYEAAAVVIEADLDRVLRGLESATLRGASPESVLGAAVWLGLRYHVPVFWCGSRQAARTFVDSYLRMFTRLRAQGGGRP